MGASKKATELLSRAERKSKKRQAEDAIPDLPGDNDDDGEEAQASEAEKSSKKRKRSSEDKKVVADPDGAERKSAKREKKRKRAEEVEGEESKAVDAEDQESEKKKKKKKSQAEEPADGGEQPAAIEEDDGTAEPKKSKKERKAERKAREAAEGLTKESKKISPAKSDNVPVGGDEAKAGEEERPKKKNNRNRDKKRKAKAEEAGESKAARFIVFIGNLPYSATKESIAKHFASVKPISVRHSTQKDNPSRSKGFAFLEFEGYDHMKTCLKLFHHSMFDDGISPARKLNVELTAGGGGNTQDRKSKIEEKNQKLNEQRVRRIQEEEKAKFAKAAEAKPDGTGIHPSRRAIVPGA
ncbi:RNA recognition domain-containing protein [Phlyctema vagabunda]|uniref:RNA recognition domain-containing protein n=1 Tax=Phlyctema vagabunda TaxID=108571 RepID=A0ABR4PA51_9HELO